MNIRFTSTLTKEDENRIAPVILESLCRVLELLPIAYSIRIETSDAAVYQHSRPNQSLAAPILPPPRPLGK